MNALEVIGILGIIYFGFRILLQSVRCIHLYLVRAPQRKEILRREKGRWAVVTGATDGIGKAYTHALAKKGLHIALISRNPDKLNACAAEIREKFSVETKTIAVDFTHDMEIYETIASGLSGLEIGVLVNNVGISYTYPENFLSIIDRDNTITALIRANVVSVPKMCAICMPGMVDRRSGVVINVSSLTAVIPAPYLSLYGGTKAFVDKFSEELRAEYGNKGIVIQTILPGYVVTNMSKLKSATWIAPTPDRFVASALNKLGVKDRTTGYNSHSLMKYGMDVLLYLCKPFAIKIVADQLAALRKRALARGRKKEGTQES